MSELKEDSQVVTIETTANFGDNLYTTQEWSDPVKISRALAFVERARELGYGTNSILTISEQREIHKSFSPDTEYAVPIATAFKRTSSKNEEVQCYAIRNGHHRIWISRLSGMALEILVDEDLGNLGKLDPRAELLSALQNRLREKENSVVVKHNNLVERTLRRLISEI